MKAIKILTATSLILTTACLAHARIYTLFAYQELYDQADLMIIAKPISTQDTVEKTTLPNIAPDVHVVGLSTEVEISMVMKGDKSLKKVTLHHYRVANPEDLLNSGPNLVSFDPSQQTLFLMFLRLEKDGRYAPVSGQTDPSENSILKLKGGGRGWAYLLKWTGAEEFRPIFVQWGQSKEAVRNGAGLSGCGKIVSVENQQLA